MPHLSTAGGSILSSYLLQTDPRDALHEMPNALHTKMDAQRNKLKMVLKPREGQSSCSDETIAITALAQRRAGKYARQTTVKVLILLNRTTQLHRLTQYNDKFCR